MVYLTIGTLLARRDYAQRVLAAGNRDTTAEIAAKEAQLKAIRHTNDCWRGPVYKSMDHNCDCRYSSHWNSLNRDIAALEADSIAVGSPYPMLFLWPVKGFDAFLRGGTVKTKALRSKDWEAQMEAICGFPGTGTEPGRYDS